MSLEQRRLSDFEVLRELGRGGMGVVYEAKQLSLGRNVALKVLTGTLGLSSRAIQRFRREAEAAARLHHTNIVPVYTIGEQDGVHFYAMELIDGPSLDRVLHQAEQANAHTVSLVHPSSRDTPIETQANEAMLTPSSVKNLSGITSSGATIKEFDHIASLIAEVANALDYAHEQGAVHRDIKPSNLLLGPNGKLSINDFGLARVLEAPNMTATGEMLGTPAYMSPEQITAGRTPLDHRTDIYSLGATLYEMLTLRPPFTGERRDQLLAQILHKDPIPPRKINKRIPIDLETICLKAIDKDPDKRYQTAGDLANDLQRYVNRFEISARRIGLVGKILKSAKRNKMISSLAVFLAIAAVGVGFLTVHSATTVRKLAESQKKSAVETAILDALSGDSEAAVKSLLRAESLGVDSGVLNLLRGLVERHRGNVIEALTYLEEANQLLVDSVAAKALLSVVYTDLGRWNDADELLRDIELGHAKTDEDHIFLALALSESDPARSIEILADLSRRTQQSDVATLVKATALYNIAIDSGQLEDAERGLDHLSRVADSSNSWYLDLRSKLLLAAVDAVDIDSDRQDEYRRLANDNYDKLSAFESNPVAVRARGSYLFAVGDFDALLVEVSAADKDGVANTYNRLYAASVYYASGRLRNALELVNQIGGDTNDLSAVANQLIVRIGYTNELNDAADTLLESIQQSEGGMSLGLYPGYFYLLGPEFSDRAVVVSREIQLRKIAQVSKGRDNWYRHLLDFHAGVIDVDRLLYLARGSKLNQCEANFLIGIRELCSGNRGKAQYFLKQCVDTKVWFYYEYVWGQAFLKRMEDPNWVPWIPVEFQDERADDVQAVEVRK